MLSQQAGGSNNKYRVNVIFAKNQDTIVHFNVILKTHSTVILLENAISCMFNLPACLACLLNFGISPNSIMQQTLQNVMPLCGKQRIVF